MQRIRGVKALVHDGVDLTTDLVAEGMESVARTLQRVTEQVEPLAAPARTAFAVRQLTTASVLSTVKLVNRALQTLSDAALASLTDPPLPQPPVEPALAMRSDVTSSASWASDAALGLVNAVVGDHLHAVENGLALDLRFRVGDSYVLPEAAALAASLPRASRKVALFVHGLGATEWSWCLGAAAYHGDPTANFGSLLERDLGYTPVWLRYNSGRHVSENGRLLAAALERFVAAYPVAIDELILVGHSMGGLVARSACHYGKTQGLSWVALVRQVFCLGSPHRGAPLEKLGNLLTGVLGAIDLPATRIPARILAGRSAGIKDLRHGTLVDDDWLGRDPDALGESSQTEVPLLPNVRYHFVSATITRDPSHPLGRLVGDLLVRGPSSSGPQTTSNTFTIETHRFGGVLHHQLQNHPAIYQVLRHACTPQPPSAKDSASS